jgi:hypothetical protein
VNRRGCFHINLFIMKILHNVHNNKAKVRCAQGLFCLQTGRPNGFPVRVNGFPVDSLD